MSLLVALTSMVTLAAPGAKDLNDACRLAKELVGQKPASFPADRQTTWYQARRAKWRSQVESRAKDETFLEMLHATQNVSAADRYVTFEKFALLVGLQKWSCPALELVLLPPDEDLRDLCMSTRRGSLDGEVPMYSARARTAWKTAQEKKGKAGYEVLRKASEWPEKTFDDDCEGLKEVMNKMVAR